MSTHPIDLSDLIPLITTYTGHSLPPKPNKIVHPWKREEDELLLQAVEEFGMKRWHLVAQRIPNRTRKQCRERYCNHLDPEIVKVPWSEKEDQILKEAKLMYGNRWTLIKAKLPGRTANQVKNRYFAKFSDLEKKECSHLKMNVKVNEMKDLNNLKDFNNFSDLNEMKEMKDFNHLNNVKDLKQLNEINEMKDLNNFSYVKDLNEMKDLKQLNERKDKDISAFVPVNEKLYTILVGGSIID